MTPANFKLQGHSSIIDSDGRVLSEIDDKAGIIYSTIDIKENNNADYESVPDYNGWIHGGSAFVRKILAPIDIRIGQKQYRRKLETFIQDNHLTTTST
jgi:hypothetical protein